MAKKNHIVILEPSAIIRLGVMDILQDFNLLNALACAELSDKENLWNRLWDLNPELVIVNPTYLNSELVSKLKDRGVKLLALQSSLCDSTTLGLYDAVISIYDSQEKIRETIATLIDQEQEQEIKTELSAREKEIVICVAKGMTNKEIADTLFLSTHTVISHRRNIAAKLEIHSSSGLTVYAIVNKLIEIESL